MTIRQRAVAGMLAGAAVAGVMLNAAPSHAASDTWSGKAAMPTARAFLAAAPGNGRIYAIGGVSSSIHAAVEAYNPATNTWTAKAAVPTARHALTAATGPAGKIYAIGGYDVAGAAVATVEAYDPATDTWATKAAMPDVRVYLAAATGPDGRIYAIGGNGANPTAGPLGTVEAYDPATDTWAAKAAMPTARSALAATTGPDGKIYAIGGADADTHVATVEAYEPTAPRSSTASPGCTDRDCLPTTGVGLTGLIAAGLTLVLSGIILILSRRRRDLVAATPAGTGAGSTAPHPVQTASRRRRRGSDRHERPPPRQGSGALS